MASRSIVKQFASKFRSFVRDPRGNISMLATLAAVPFIAAVGVGVDYGRVAMETSALGAAVDSALLAIISSEKSNLTGLSDTQKTARLAELEDMAEEYLMANFNSDNAIGADIDAAIVIDEDTVTMTAAHAIPTSLMSFLGVENVNVTVVSEAKRQKKASVPIEIAVVMDTTGSMGSTYMSQAKTAARTLMNTIYGGTLAEKPESSQIRAALVPFSAAVRLNKAAYDFNLNWIDTTGTSSVNRLNFPANTLHNWSAWEALNIPSTNGSKWNGCVEARPRGTAPNDFNTNDAPPTTANTRFVPYFAPDEPTFSNSDESPYNFDNSYISTSGTPRETTGISTTLSSPPTTAQLTNRQRNNQKYVNKAITSEAESSKGPWYNCAATPIVPMTYNRSKIEAGITAMTAAGNTVIPEGLAWGWRALSPTEPFTKVEGGAVQPATTISEYGSEWKKVLVLMTDGENNVLSNGAQVNTLNGSLYSAYGYSRLYGSTTVAASNRFGTTTATSTDNALDDATLALCENIKAEGVTIYTVAFRVTAATILDNLESCATSLDHYSYAATGTELAQVFQEIGESVTSVSVRLSK